MQFLLLHLLLVGINQLIIHYLFIYLSISNNLLIISFVVAGTANAGFNVVLTALINIAWVAGNILIIMKIIIINRYNTYIRLHQNIINYNNNNNNNNNNIN